MHNTTVGLRKLNTVGEKYKQLLLEDLDSRKIQTETVESCICCGSTVFDKLLDIDRFGLPFGSHLCRACGLVFTSPRITQASLPYYYEKYYHPLNYGKESLDDQTALFQEGQGKKIFQTLKPYLDKSNLSVLEIGTGVGSVLDEFRSQAHRHDITVEATGTEYSPECIIQCQKRNIQTIQGNASSVLALQKQFDVIILSHVFEHFIDLVDELQTLKALLADDGVLYVEVPGILHIHDKAYYDYTFVGYTTHAHMYNFSAVTLKNIFEQHGFRPLQSNEAVEAVFCKTETSDKTTLQNDSLRIKHYLEFLDPFREDTKNREAACQKAIAHEHERIAYREKEIEKYKTQVQNREKEIEKYKTQVENRNREIAAYRKQAAHLSRIKKEIQMLQSRHPLKKYKAYKALLRELDANA